MNSQVIDLANPSWKETLANITHDIYQIPEYILLEANRSKGEGEAIIIKDQEQIFFVPYLISSCESAITNEFLKEEIFDIKSPYGYPGILLSDEAANSPDFVRAAFAEFQEILKSKNVCTAFLRMHPIINENLVDILPLNTLTENGETVSIDLRIPEEKLWSHTRKGHKSTINKCKRMGMEAKFVPIAGYINEFTAIYQETMARVGASDKYYSFDFNYYDEMRKALGERLHLCIVEHENEVACVGLYTEVCGIVQSLLGGTKDKFVHLSPSSLETDYARYWAHRRGNKFLHLGGGIGGWQDHVYRFKAGFSKLRHPFYTLRLIIDQDKYDYLVNLKAKLNNIAVEKLRDSDFFPAYRSSLAVKSKQ
ncbi:MAG: peptidoglycan bridge formation glycyltransferase FemA/FemB family protein [Pleurocapsa sp.]